MSETAIAPVPPMAPAIAAVAAPAPVVAVEQAVIYVGAASLSLPCQASNCDARASSDHNAEPKYLR